MATCEYQSGAGTLLVHKFTNLSDACTGCSGAGIAEFIDTALENDAAIGLVGGTCSVAEEQIMTAALFALGEERTQRLHTFVCDPQQQSQDSDKQQESFDGLTLEQGMAAARARVSRLLYSLH